jgi:hypothetical protein
MIDMAHFPCSTTGVTVSSAFPPCSLLNMQEPTAGFTCTCLVPIAVAVHISHPPALTYAAAQTLVKRAKHGDDFGDLDRTLASNIAKRQKFKETDLDADAEYDYDAGLDL